jgi:hypothetical protein
MNRKEHLLLIASEEALEISHAIHKALRFGLAKGEPGTTRTNAGDVGIEIAQFKAMLEMLAEEGITFPEQDNIFHQQQKKIAVEKFLGYSKDRGTLTEN